MSNFHIKTDKNKIMINTASDNGEYGLIKASPFIKMNTLH